MVNDGGVASSQFAFLAFDFLHRDAHRPSATSCAPTIIGWVIASLGVARRYAFSGRRCILQVLIRIRNDLAIEDITLRVELHFDDLE